jgi:hypothetical protein
MAFRKLNPVTKLVAYAAAKQRGDQKVIAEQTGFTSAYVSMTLKGLRNNISVVNTAYRLIHNRQTNLQKLSAALA